MTFDQAQSPRLGQPTAVENPGIRSFTGADLPEVGYSGQLIYRSDTQLLQYYNGVLDAWQDVSGANPGSLTFVQPDPPTALNDGDIWFDSDDSHHPYVWNGSIWVDVQDGSIAAAAADAASALTAAGTAQTAADNALAVADGKITTFFQSTAPTTGMDEGDLWFNTTDKQAHLYHSGAWTSVQDAAITTALTNAAAAQSTADGKITSFYAANTATPTAEGDGDVWYVTDMGNLIRYWNAATSAWIDLPAGSGAIGENAINGTHLDADNITGLTLTGNIIRTAATGARVEMGPAGLYVYDSANVGRQVAALGGDVTANNLTVNKDTVLTGNLLAYGTYTLSAGIVDPTTAPSASSTWQYTTQSGASHPSSCLGLTSDGGSNLVTVYKGDGTSSNQPYLVFINPVTGVVTEQAITWSITGTNVKTALGVTKIGSYYYLLTRYGSTFLYYLHKIDSTGTELAATNINGVVLAGMSSVSSNPVVGTDGTYFCVSFYGVSTVAGAGAHTQVINPATGGSIQTNSYLVSVTPAAAVYGNGDFGSARTIFCLSSSSTTRVVTGAANQTRQTGDEWTLSGSNIVGICYDGTRYWTMDSSGKITKHSTRTADQSITFTYNYYDGSSQHTKASTASVATTILKRAYALVTTSAPPSSPAGLQVQVNAGTGSRYLQSAITASPWTAYVGALLTATAEPTTNTFTGAGITPAKLVAAAGGWNVDGNSNGSIGTGTLRDSVNTLISAAIAAARHDEWSVSANRNTDTGTLAASSNNVVNWNNTVTDPSNILATSTFTVPAGGAGTWRMMYNIWWQGDNTGRRSTWISKNDSSGAGIIAQVSHDAISTGSPSTRQCLAWEGRLAVGDVLRVYTFHTSSLSGGLAIQSGSWVSFEWVRA